MELWALMGRWAWDTCTFHLTPRHQLPWVQKALQKQWITITVLGKGVCLHKGVGRLLSTNWRHKLFPLLSVYRTTESHSIAVIQETALTSSIRVSLYILLIQKHSVHNGKNIICYFYDLECNATQQACISDRDIYNMLTEDNTQGGRNTLNTVLVYKQK